MSQEELSPPPKKTDERFDNWVFRLWNRVYKAGQITIAQLGIGTGTANQLLKVGTSGTAFELANLSGTSPIDLVFGAGSISLAHGTSGVVSGTYGNGANVPQYAVNTYGHITLATNVAISTAPGNFYVSGTFTSTNNIRIGPNSAAQYLQLGGAIAASYTNDAAIFVSDGNLHIDAADANTIYLNHYGGAGGVAFSNGTFAAVAWMGPDGDLWKGAADNSGSPYFHAGNLIASSPIVFNTGGTSTFAHATSGVTPGTFGSAFAGNDWVGTSAAIVAVSTYGHVTAAATIPRTAASNAMANFGQLENHGVYNDFNTVPAAWGWTFVQGTANAPNTISSQWYRARLSLGYSYDIGTSATAYWLELGIPRDNYSGSAGGIYQRVSEAGVVTAWRLAHPAGITPGTFGSASVIPQVVLNDFGHVTAINTLNVAIGGTAITGADLTISSPLTGTVTNALLRAGSIAHATSGVASGTYGNGYQVGQFVVDTYGHVTSAAAVAISSATGNFHVAGTLTSTNNAVFGPNAYGVYLEVGSEFPGSITGTLAERASVVVSNGNLHIDARKGAFALYLNLYNGSGGIAFGDANSSANAWMGPDGDLWKGPADNQGSPYFHSSNLVASSPIVLNTGGTSTVVHSTSGVASGTYGGTAGSVRLVLDTYGHITAASNVAPVIQQTIQNGGYTLVAGDANGHVYRAGTATGVCTWTVPSNASVAYSIGTPITLINEGTGNVTLAIDSDTLVFAGTGATGSRTLPQYSEATILKVTSTRWMISGAGVY